MIEHKGWRIYSRGPDGLLLPPYVDRLLPDLYDAERDAWQPGVNRARCVLDRPLPSDHWRQVDPGEVAEPGHAVPAEGCRCGIRVVTELDELLANTAADYFPNSEHTILDECGVVAEVVGFGRFLPGTDMPLDDPHSTVRVERAYLLQVYVGPGLLTHGPSIQKRYGVPVLPAPDWWPRAPGPVVPALPPGEEAYLADLQASGFGVVDVEARSDALLTMGHAGATALRGGAPAEEVLRGVFDSSCRPTLHQAEAFVLSVLRNLCPEVYPERGWVWSKPVTVGEALMRSMGVR